MLQTKCKHLLHTQQAFNPKGKMQLNKWIPKMPLLPFPRDNPNALLLFREEPHAMRKTKEAEQKDAEKTKMPEPPVTGGMKTGTSGMG